MKTVRHPTCEISITFDPITHTYRDDLPLWGRETVYESVTALVARHFPAFDEATNAAAVAARTGRLGMDIIAEWHRKRNEAAAYGTRVHAYAEARVNATMAAQGTQGTPEPTMASPSVPDSDRRAFGVIDRAVSMLATAYEFIASEQIVFDPIAGVAGTIDLIARNRTTGNLALLDWKTNEDITDDSFSRVGLPPITHVRDSKVNRYALQLSVYAWIIADPLSYYPTAGEPVELAVIHIPHVGDDPVWRPMPYMPREAEALVGASIESTYAATETRKVGAA